MNWPVQLRRVLVSKGLPTYSVIIEWENARLSELGRASEMLKQLYKQIMEVKYPRPEIIILHDKDHVERQLIEQVLGEVSELEAWPADIRIIATEGLNYYEQKNFGARQSSTDVIIFLDSDVIPERGWLVGLLQALQNPDIQVVCGNAYISLESLYSKAFALFWFFPLRSQESGLVRTTSDYSKANNIAFRREVFEAFQYPSLPTFRGQCGALRRTLGDHGVDTFLQRGSRVSHPAPNGLRHFINRAVCTGYDMVLVHRPQRSKRANSLAISSKKWNWRHPRRSLKQYRRHLRRAQKQYRRHPRRALKQYRRDLRRSLKQYRALNQYRGDLHRSLKRVLQRYQHVQLGPVSVVGALGIGACYYALVLVGVLLTIVRPELVRRHFSM